MPTVSATTKALSSASPIAWIKGGDHIEGAPLAGGTCTTMPSEAAGHGTSSRGIAGTKCRGDRGGSVGGD
jgi:hypothetical protein